ncbi:LLM class flavin-dependent oxidoreductase [Micromonospora sp. WMMD1102]|uniref:LLM class flavin-dependent oxidoreductase n=1 Tax=Micromonospora sp. WMMD1102 TaxID=3016105 RepID=UPI00241532F1|nr:LLM class flavin-dependent oxidoreductase [Micromonospora sp. WMMD1102]MDG4788034.1 LLM class flavin-dependent oxidoreductase [Micromonospora sp. WMMD1102]
MEFHWFLPLSPDVEQIGLWPEEGPEPTLPYLTEIVTEAEAAGCAGLLVPATFRNHHDALIATAAVLARTERAALLVAVRPFQFHPAQFAKMTATLLSWFPGRLRLNVVGAGGDEPAMLGVGDDREARQRRMAEWMEVFTGVLYGGRTFSYAGEFYQVTDFLMVESPTERVPIYLSGSSAVARALLARYGTHYLMYGLPPDAAAAEVTRLRAVPDLSAVRICMRLHLIVRRTSAEAWAAADHLVSRVDPRVAAIMRNERHEAESKLSTVHKLASSDELVVAPNLWAGVGTARRGAALALVGTPDEVTARLVEYHDLGVDSVIVSGYPKLREVARFRELLLPRLREAGLA